MDDFIKQLRSGRHNNQLIETVGGCQHYVSNLKSADRIEKLEFRDKQSREDMVTMASVNSTLYAKIEQLEGQLTNAVNHLHRAKRRLYDSSFDECIAACNHVLSPPQEKDDECHS